MPTTISQTYGPGGYDPQALNGNIVGSIVANDDGTVTVTENGVATVHSNDAVTARVAAVLTARAVEENGTSLRDRARTALTSNATFLTLASPTNAQTLAQVRSLTRQVNALIRLEVGALDNVTGT